MLNIKDVIGVIAVLLTFAGYVPYVRDTIKGKTTPHVYTWFIWGFVTAIAFGLQITHNAGPGAFTTLAAAIVCLVICGFGVRQGSKNVTKSDSIFFVLSLLTLVLWLIIKQPVAAVILASTIDMLGFIPTIRKSWRKPYEETLVSYQTNTLRFCLALFALNHYTLITTLYPVSWVLANGLFSAYLVMRRKTVTAPIGWQG
jgi:hypothetical protein